MDFLKYSNYEGTSWKRYRFVFWMEIFMIACILLWPVVLWFTAVTNRHALVHTILMVGTISAMAINDQVRICDVIFPNVFQKGREFFAVCKDSYVVYTCSFDRNGKWEWFCESKLHCKNDIAEMTLQKWHYKMMFQMTSQALTTLFADGIISNYSFNLTRNSVFLVMPHYVIFGTVSFLA